MASASGIDTVAVVGGWGSLQGRRDSVATEVKFKIRGSLDVRGRVGESV